MQKNKNKYIQKNKKTNKSKTVIIIIILTIIIVIGAVFFTKNNNNMAKISKIGDNSSSQEIVDYILNISSYESLIDVEVQSNKNSNKYKIKQAYIDNENYIQEVLEPSNIQGVKIIKEKNTLKVENSKLSITKILENYQDITQNNLDLTTFIENYKNNENSKFKEENNQIIMETELKTENKYQKYETLYINKATGKPTKMEIKDINQNTIIYIIYNEININNKSSNKIFAFQLKELSKEI